MKIGFMQIAPLLGDVHKTMEKIYHLIEDSVPVDLLVLPELCNSGYNFVSSKQAWETSEEVADSVFVRFLEGICKDKQFHIVSGLNERDGDLLYNSAVLIGPHGYVGKYRKLHLFFNEKDHFQPGDFGLPVFDIGTCKIGMLVCFDWMFPEGWRVLALKGADIICHPSNLVLPGLAQKGVPIHALVNHVFTITANRVGTERDLNFTGRSMIANPKGEVISQAAEKEEIIKSVIIEIDQARDKKITSKNDLFKDRRPSEYSLISQKN